MFLFGSGRPKITQPAALSGLQLQSSVYGTPIPIVYGTTRVAPNLIWYGDFKAIPQSSSGGSAGKGGVGGGGGGKGGGGAVTYNYQAAVALALCEGPIQGVGAVYVDKNVTTAEALGMSTFLGTYPQDAWGYIASTQPGVSETVTVPGSPYQVTVAHADSFLADAGVVGPPTVSRFTRVSDTPAAGEYSTSFSGGVTASYKFNSADAGTAVTIEYAGSYGASQSLVTTIPTASPYTVRIETPYGYFQDHGVTATNIGYAKVTSGPGAAQYSVTSGGVYTFNSANSGQQVTITYATVDADNLYQALGYNGIAYMAAAAYQLGNSAQLPNHNFEVKGIYSYSLLGGSIPDADPSAIVTDLLTNAHYGAGFPVSRIGDLSTFQAYCIANGLWISLLLNQQTQISSVLSVIEAATNASFVWSSGLLTLVPFGDEDITANGYTYTAPSQAEYDLTDDDFIITSDDPVRLSRKRPADAVNSLKLECLDRSSAYAPAVVEAKDQALIDAFGLIQAPSQPAHLFCDLTAGRLSAQLQLQRQAVRNIYQFTLDQRYILLDPMNIVTLTDAALGLSQQWVRITEIAENDDGTLAVTAEEYLSGSASAPAYTFQAASGFAADYNASPGDANEPVIFEPPIQITDTGLETWLAASGGPEWGGCDVWVSSDNQTYKLAGRITGSCRQGVLAADLASVDDPDMSSTLSVDLTESRGQLLSGTKDDADAYHTLCYADGELVSYQTATLTAQHEYDLTYLRRGAYGTTVSAHAAGTRFVRLDDGLFKIPYDKTLIGSTIYIKLVSFNIYGGGQQQLSDLTAYVHVIAGPPKPEEVQNFTAQQVEGTVAFKWDDLSTDAGLKGYDIAYAPMGTTDWEEFSLLTEAHRGTEMTNASVAPGTWTFAIRGHDIADQLGPMSTFDLVVTNDNEVIVSAQQHPDWLGFNPGIPQNFYRHYTGVLVPLSQNTADFYERTLPPLTPTLVEVAGGSLGGTTYYVKTTYVGIYGETTPSSEASLAVSPGNLLYVTTPGDPPDTGSSNILGWNVYVGTSSGTETLQNISPISLMDDWLEPASGLVTGVSPPTFNSIGWDVFDIFVPDVINGGFKAEYDSPEYDTGFDAEVRAWISYTLLPGPGQSGEPFDVFSELEWRLTAGPSQHSQWTLGLVTLRYATAQLWYFPAEFLSPAQSRNPGNIFYLSALTLTIDTVPQIENGASAVIAPGGTAITFPTPYHSTPNVQCTVVGSSALYASASSITTTGFTAHVWNSSGTDVGGTINWTATGE